jgi:alpha-1,3-rhamnosyl/mannosyltransferase
VLISVEQLRRPLPGGIGTATSGLLQGLSECSPQVRSGVVLYASLPSGNAEPHPEADPLARYDLPILASSLPPFVLTRLWARGLARPKRRVSLVHATSFQYPPATAPLICTVHDLAWRHVPEAFHIHGRLWHEAALKRATRQASAFVVPSMSVADDLVSSGFDLGDRPVEVIHWGSDHLAEPDDAACGELLTRLGVDGPFLLTVSTIEPRKNLNRLIEGYGLARAAMPDPPSLLVVGPDGWGKGVVAGDGVILAGRVEGRVLAALYRRALGFAYVPLHEGFGLPVLEAMAQGLPVLSSPVPSASAGTLLVDPHDVDSIRDGIVTLCTDERVRSELSAGGRALATRHTWLDVAQAHIALWRRFGAEIPL